MTDVGHTRISPTKAIGAVGVIVGVGVVGWMYFHDGKAEVGTPLEPLKFSPIQQPVARETVEKVVYTPPIPRTETKEQGERARTDPQAGRQNTARTGGGQRKPTAAERLEEQALAAGVGGWSDDQADEKIKAKLASTGRRSDFKPNGCIGPGLGLVRPATPVRLQIDYKVVNEIGGFVAGHVVQTVMDSRMMIHAIPDGTTFTADYKRTETKGAKRIEIGKPTFTRPEPRNDELTVEGQMSDREGAAGVPGDVDYPWVSAGLLVAADTAVQLGVAALSGGGSLIGSIFADQAEAPLSKAAKDLLDRTPTISLEPGEEVVLLLKHSICADDFWG